MDEAGSPAPQPLRKASEWMIALLEAPDDRGLRRRFEAWLAADPAHALDWQEMSATFGALEELRQERAGTSSAVAISRRPRRRLVLGLAAACAMAVAALAAPEIVVRLQADHRTGIAELRTVILPDGSTAQLAPQSAIEVAYDGTARRIRLLKGEALFTVVHRSDRSFSVEAAGVEVVDIGTAFDVRLRDGGADVAVQEGLVEVSAPQAVPPARARLEAGDWLRAVAHRPAERGRIPPGQVAAWTERRLVVKDTPVAEIVDALRPYFAGYIVVNGDALAAQRLTGVYDLGQPAEALRAIARAQGGSVRQVSPWVLVLSGG